MRMQSESIIVSNFNLYYSLWTRFFYSRQHVLFETLLEFMRVTNAKLILFENTIIKDRHKKRTTINLFFTTNALINRLIKCDINSLIKNFFDHLFIKTCVKLCFIKKSTRRSHRDWKFMNLEKFKQYFETHSSKSLSKAKSERQRINEYIESLLKSIERTMKNFTLWAKIYNRSKEF